MILLIKINLMRCQGTYILKYQKKNGFCIQLNINYFCYLPISKIRVRVRLGFSNRVRIRVQILKYLSPPRDPNLTLTLTLILKPNLTLTLILLIGS